MFTRNNDIHSHDTRQKLHLHVPLPKTNLVKMSVCYTGVTGWNYCTTFIDTYCSLDVYKKILKMYLHKHQWKCRVSTMFIHLILVTLLITNGCNITVYLLYLSHQPVYPIQFIQQQLVYFQCVYYAPFAPVVCTLQTILFREYRSLSTSKVSCSICHHYCWLSCFVFSQYVLISVDIFTVPVLFPCVMAITWLNLKTWIGSDDDLAGAKPLWEPFMVSLLAHICVTWPHWVKN